MATYEKHFLSGSSFGRPVDISASLNETIHTASATSQDEVWIWISNTSENVTKNVVALFYSADIDDEGPIARFTIPPKTTILAFSGLLIQASATGATGARVLKLGDVTDDSDFTRTMVYGYVNRITP
jgi:hypothetical protein